MKILFLSLGTGSLFGKNEDVDKRELLTKMLEENEYAYSTLNYRLGQKIYKSPFVAEALIDQYKPDYILLVGTVKSAWSSFYANFYEEDNKFENILTLYEQEQENGLRESKDKSRLAQFEETIKSIIHPELSVGGNEIRIDIKVLSYGMDSDELELNYYTLSDKWNEVVESVDDEEIEIAFDITHSFRSMPLYNITILNYLLNASRKHIRLSHVYYGNMEAANENDGNAEILDLCSITDIFRLTSGVIDFSSSGNSQLLIKEISDEDPEVSSRLEEFDWAMQTNKLFMITESLKALRKELSQRDLSSRFYAIYKMLLDSLESSFPSENDLNNLEDLDNHISAYANVQRMIGAWHFQHGRYGQAIVNADESLKSYVTSLYLKAGGDCVTKDDVSDRGKRQGAFSSVMSRAITQYEECKEYYPDMADCLVRLEHLQKVNHGDRNVFAHFLWAGDMSSDADEIQTYRRVKNEIGEFYNELEMLQRLVHDEPVKAVGYMKKLRRKKKANKDGTTANQKEKTSKPKYDPNVVHHLTQLKLSGKKKSICGVLENGTRAILILTEGMSPDDIHENEEVYIVSKGPQESVVVRPVKEKTD